VDDAAEDVAASGNAAREAVTGWGIGWASRKPRCGLDWL